MAQIDGMLTYLKENDGSDLHLAAGLEPRVRAKGKLQRLPGREVLTEHVPKEVDEVLSLVGEQKGTINQ